MSDLFPKIREEPIDYGTLEKSIRNVCAKKNLKDVDGSYSMGTHSLFLYCLTYIISAY